MVISLGKLKKVEDLRKIWNHEALDFTKWLSKKDNLLLLSEEIGIDISLIDTEAEVGSFNVDILAEEANTGRKIVIENQLEKTNHDHLGKIITYASGYDAEIIIWIVKEVRDEHRQAIEWLNKYTDEKINFFAIEMELWQIDDSQYAPKFQVISKPNDWAKTIKNSSIDCNYTDTKLKQLEFWTSFNDFCKNINSNFSVRKPYPQHWYDISIGTSKAWISLTINSQENKMGCELYISGSRDPNENTKVFNSLFEKKEQIEIELNENLEWMSLEGKKASRIKLSKEFDFNNKKEWDAYFTWLADKAIKFKTTFSKQINK